MKKKRIVAIGDLHSGHRAGLTHPDYWQKEIKYTTSIQERVHNKFARIQRAIWRWYEAEMEAIKPIHICFNLGDNIDGRGERSGSTELIAVDQNIQCTMAVKALRIMDAQKYFMAYGTPYHTCSGYAEWEDSVAEGIRAEQIGARVFVDVNGVIFDLRHKMSKSTIPHGQGTLLAKQKLWNDIWSLVDVEPNADVSIRAHIHDFLHMHNFRWHAISLPGMEWSTKFGSRVVDGMVNIGYVIIDVEEDGTLHIYPRECKLGIMKSKLVKA